VWSGYYVLHQAVSFALAVVPGHIFLQPRHPGFGQIGSAPDMPGTIRGSHRIAGTVRIRNRFLIIELAKINQDWL
jgi:hypothetical protein